MRLEMMMRFVMRMRLMMSERMLSNIKCLLCLKRRYLSLFLLDLTSALRSLSPMTTAAFLALSTKNTWFLTSSLVGTLLFLISISFLRCSKILFFFPLLDESNLFSYISQSTTYQNSRLYVIPPVLQE